MSEQSQTSRSVVDEAMLRAFAKGELDETTEDRVVALLEKKPELQAKVAAISIGPVVAKMQAHSQIVAVNALASQFDQPPLTTVSSVAVDSIDVPTELESLSEFQILKELGRGGMGVVYLAENKWMGNRKEVLKVLNERMLGSKEAKQRFQKEIEITASLDHPSIVRSYCVRPIKDLIILSMEYVAGRNLYQFIYENGQLPVPVACQIAMDVCDGLQHAMLKGAVHRDIKPANIMLFRDDSKKIRAKILDFGLARASDNQQSRGLTQDGTLLGTLEYISPEQCMDANKADIRADIYSLGCALYHMLVGHPPFLGSAGELILAHAQKIPPTANLINPAVSVQLGSVIAKMLAKQPDRRFQTPHEIAVELKPFLAHKRSKKSSNDGSLAPDTKMLSAAAQDTSIEIRRNPKSEIVKAISIPMSQSQVVVPKDIASLPRDFEVVDKPKAIVRPKLNEQRMPRVAAGLLALVLVGIIVLGIILNLDAGNGTIVIENLPEDCEVFVDGKQVKPLWDDGKAALTSRVGERVVSVVQGGTEIEVRKIAVKAKPDARFQLTMKEDLKAPDNLSRREPESQPVMSGQVWQGILKWQKGPLRVHQPRGATYELTIKDVDLKSGMFNATYRWDAAPSGKPNEGESFEVTADLAGSKATWSTGNPPKCFHSAVIFDDRIEVELKTPTSRGKATLHVATPIEDSHVGGESKR